MNTNSDIFEFIYTKDKEQKEELGIVASKWLQMSKLGIEIPQGFIISSDVFDNYIQYNNLVEEILNELAELEGEADKKAKHASKKIQKLILEGQLSLEFISQLKIFYKRFSAFSKAPTKILASCVNEELDESMQKEMKVISGISNFDDLLKAIQALWAHLFSEKALKYREDLNYEGPLSMAVIVVKEPISEVSAVVKKIKNLKGREDIEIEAVLGRVDPLVNSELIGDRYIYSTDESAIIEKQVNEQKWMLITNFSKNKFEDKKIDISKIWRLKQKLSDNQVDQLAKLSQRIFEKISNRFLLKFTLELGQFVLVDFEELADISIPLFPSDVKDIGIKEELEKSLEIKDLDSQKIELSHPKKEIKNLPRKKNINIDEYVKEVEEELSKVNLEVIEEEEEMNEKDVKAEIEVIEKITTLTGVWALDYTEEEYLKYEKNIDGFLNLSGDDFVLSFGKNLNFLIQNPQKTYKLLEKYIIDFLSQVEQNVIYTFSSQIYRQDLKSVFGAERLLGGNSLFEIELDVIRHIRNTLDKKNLWVAVPFVRDVNEFMDVKKSISLAKLRRSSTFKVYTQIDNLVSATLSGDLIDAGTDGFIYNWDLCVQNSFGVYVIGETPTYGVKKVIQESIKQIASRKIDAIMVARGVDKDIKLKEIFKWGFTDVGIPINEIKQVKKQLRKIEKSKLK